MMKTMKTKKTKKKKKMMMMGRGIDWIEIELSLGMEKEERKEKKRQEEDIQSRGDQKRVDLSQSLKMRPKIPKLKQRPQSSFSLLPFSLDHQDDLCVVDLHAMIQTMTLSCHPLFFLLLLVVSDRLSASLKRRPSETTNLEVDRDEKKARRGMKGGKEKASKGLRANQAEWRH